VYFSEDNIRRFNCQTFPNWSEFMTLLSDNFSSFFQPQGHKIQYIDDEGDKIQVSSQFEWEEMFCLFSGSQKLYKLYVSEIVSPACGNRWRGGRGWGSRGGCKRWQQPFALQWKGLRLLKEKLYKEASDKFREQSTLQPENPIPVYNIACAESLMGNIGESLIYLNQSVDLGYRDLQHMLNDEDLVNIRQTEGFNAVCLRLKELLCSSSVPQPEPFVFEPQSVPVDIVTPQLNPVVIPSPQPVPQPEEVIPEPQPQTTNPWTTHLTLFHEMGYLNDELITSLLEKYQGDVQRTIMALLESSTIY